MTVQEVLLEYHYPGFDSQFHAAEDCRVPRVVLACPHRYITGPDLPYTAMLCTCNLLIEDLVMAACPH
jgi:hypothetical protein